jgi:D-alanyl-D-alanine carboxypeptidase
LRSSLAAAALALAVLSSCAHRSAAPVVRASTPPTPIAAAPNAPSWSTDDLRTLRVRLGAALGASALATSGIAILDAQGRPLFVRRERTPMTPASTLKLLVGAASLETLGPAFRFSTTFETDDDPRDGAIDGNLYLVGSGDPTLTRDDLRAGVASVARDGVQRVDGALVTDASLFSGPEVNRAWDPDDLQYGYAAGTSALSLDQGTVEMHLIPTTVGAPARVRVIPTSTDVRTLGAVTTSYSTLLSIVRAPDRNDFTLSGHIAAGAEQSFWTPVVNQPRYVAGVARAMLRERGVTASPPSSPTCCGVIGPRRCARSSTRCSSNRTITSPSSFCVRSVRRAVRGPRRAARSLSAQCCSVRARRRTGCALSTAAASRRATASRQSRLRRCSREPRSSRSATFSSTRCRALGSREPYAIGT